MDLCCTISSDKKKRYYQIINEKKIPISIKKLKDLGYDIDTLSISTSTSEEIKQKKNQKYVKIDCDLNSLKNYLIYEWNKSGYEFSIDTPFEELINTKHDKLNYPIAWTSISHKPRAIKIMIENGLDLTIRIWNMSVLGFLLTYSQYSKDEMDNIITVLNKRVPDVKAPLMYLLPVFAYMQAIPLNRNFIKLFRLLLKENDITQRDENGNTVLDYVNASTPISIIKELLDAGADKLLNIKNSYGVIPIANRYHYDKQKYEDIVKLYIEYGSDVNDPNFLIDCVCYCSLNIFKLVLDHGAKIDKQLFMRIISYPLLSDSEQQLINNLNYFIRRIGPDNLNKFCTDDKYVISHLHLQFSKDVIRKELKLFLYRGIRIPSIVKQLDNNLIIDILKETQMDTFDPNTYGLYMDDIDIETIETIINIRTLEYTIIPNEILFMIFNFMYPNPVLVP